MGQFKEEGVSSAEISILISVVSCRDYRLRFPPTYKSRETSWKQKEKNSTLTTFIYPGYHKREENESSVVELRGNYGNE